MRLCKASAVHVAWSLVALIGCGSGDDDASGGAADASHGDATVAPDGAPIGPGTDGGGVIDGAAREGSTTVDASDGAATAKGPPVAYASGYGPNIAVFAVDPATGALTATSSIAAGDPSPSFLAVRPGATHLYAVGETQAGRVGAYAIDATSGALSYLGGVSSQGNGPAFVTVDATGKWVMVANYGDGATAVLPINADGTLGAPTDTRTPGMNAHMMIADATNKYVFVPCLGSDYVAQFKFDAATGKLTENTPAHFTTAAGAGPRHLAFHPGGAFAYLLSETASAVTSLAFDATTGLLSGLETQTTLPVGYTGKNTAAEIWVHPSGKFVYASNRGDDSIAVFTVDGATGKLTPKAHTKTGGTGPRSFTLAASGAYLYAANQGSSTLTTFAVDAAQGTLTAQGTPLAQNQVSFVGLVRLPGM